MLLNYLFGLPDSSTQHPTAVMAFLTSPLTIIQQTPPTTKIFTICTVVFSLGYIMGSYYDPSVPGKFALIPVTNV
jgi:hypothetical protein